MEQDPIQPFHTWLNLPEDCLSQKQRMQRKKYIEDFMTLFPQLKRADLIHKTAESENDAHQPDKGPTASVEPEARI